MKTPPPLLLRLPLTPDLVQFSVANFQGLSPHQAVAVLYDDACFETTIGVMASLGLLPGYISGSHFITVGTLVCLLSKSKARGKFFRRHPGTESASWQESDAEDLPEDQGVTVVGENQSAFTNIGVLRAFGLLNQTFGPAEDVEDLDEVIYIVTK